MQNPDSGIAKSASLPWHGDFETPPYEAWRKAVESELKGAPFEKKLVTQTYEGIALQPLYRREDVANLPQVNSLPGFVPYLRGTRASGYQAGSWEISQEITDATPSDFNTNARAFLGRGLTGLNIVLDRATRDGFDPDWAQAGQVGVGGLSIATFSDLERALEGIDLAKVPLFVRSGSSAMPFAALLVALCRQRKLATKDLHGCIEMDPLGVLAHEGRLPQSLDGAYREMAELLRWARVHSPQLQTICVHARSWHEAGGHAVQELAFSLATAVEYLRAMHERGLDVDTVAPRTRFAMTVGSNFFMEIAKLRAARLLWASLIKALGGSEQAMKLVIHVRTCQWNKTALEPYVNLLRVTVEAFAGVMGGCDSMQVGAFDEVTRTPGEFSQRIARNTQIILQKECNLDRVCDPAGGSWYVEHLTDALARQAWSLFQEVERRGGMAKAMRDGFPQEEVAKTAAAKLKNVAGRRDVIVGANQYVNLKETPLPETAVDTEKLHKRRVQQIQDYRTSGDDERNVMVMDGLAQLVGAGDGERFEACVQAVSAGATLGEITRALRLTDHPDAPLKPVKFDRAAKQFERLRSAVEAHTARVGARPKVHLATLGPPAQHKARADFCRGFFGTVGLDVVYAPGSETEEEAVRKVLESGAQAVVICSTDETYPTVVPKLAPLLKALNPRRVVMLAGYPTAQIEGYRSAGVDEFVHIRSNAVELLSHLLGQLGVNL